MGGKTPRSKRGRRVRNKKRIAGGNICRKAGKDCTDAVSSGTRSATNIVVDSTS
jgi:hypothetical protein